MAKLMGQNGDSALIMCRTSKDRIQQGVPVIVKGEGSTVFDKEGNAYIDLTSGVTRPVHVGHGRKELAEAAAKQAAEMAYFTPMLFATQPSIDLAESLARFTPGGLNNFFFVCDGSEAVESAMKLAKQSHACRGNNTRFKII